jgi:site-specific DNA recombinase
MNQPISLIRPGAYGRVSSDRQSRAGTIASQVEALRQRVEADGLRIGPDDWYLDDGFSGDVLLRPALERLRDRVAAGCLDRLYVLSPDRLARNFAHQAVLLDELKHYGVEVTFLNRPLNGSPEDDLLAQVQAAVAEYERTKIQERSRRGRLYAARQGRVSVLSGAPYGYRYVSKQEGGGAARYEAVPEQAEVVRQVFHWCGVERWPLRRICKRLRELRIRSPKGRPRWSAKTVAGLLGNPAYMGQAGYGKTQAGPVRPRPRRPRGCAEVPRRPRSVRRTPGRATAIAVPALVSAELFAAAAEQLAENRRRQRQRQEAGAQRYLLSGLLECAACGYALYGKPAGRRAKGGPRRRYDYYRCLGSDASRHGGECLCQNRAVRADYLEGAVWQDACALLQDPGMVEREYKRREGEQEEEKEVAGARRGGERRKALERKLERLIDAYTDGLVRKEEFEPRVKALREQVAAAKEEEAEQQRRQSEGQGLRLVLGCLEEFAHRVHSDLQQVDWATKRDILNKLVKKVLVSATEVTVVYRVGLPPFDGSPTRGVFPHCYRGQPAGAL